MPTSAVKGLKTTPSSNSKAKPCFRAYFPGPKFVELFHEGEKYAFSDASFSSDSCAIVTSSTDGQVKLWDSENGKVSDRSPTM